MTAPSTGYFSTKESIKAIASEDRANGYLLTAIFGENLRIYTFFSGSTAAANDESVLLPDDNPVTGRWHEYGESSFMYELQCVHDCSVGNKIVKLHSGLTVPIVVVPGYDIDITTNSSSIAVRRWTQEPSLSFEGKEVTPVATFSNEGGACVATGDVAHRWFTFEVRNPEKDDIWDTACVLAEKSGNYLLITLVEV